MVEQTHPRVRHGDAVLPTGGDDLGIPRRASRLGDEADAVALGAIHVVAEGDEAVAGH